MPVLDISSFRRSSKDSRRSTTLMPSFDSPMSSSLLSRMTANSVRSSPMIVNNSPLVVEDTPSPVENPIGIVPQKPDSAKSLIAPSMSGRTLVTLVSPSKESKDLGFRKVEIGRSSKDFSSGNPTVTRMSTVQIQGRKRFDPFATSSDSEAGGAERCGSLITVGPKSVIANVSQNKDWYTTKTSALEMIGGSSTGNSLNAIKSNNEILIQNEFSTPQRNSSPHETPAQSPIPSNKPGLLHSARLTYNSDSSLDSFGHRDSFSRDKAEKDIRYGLNNDDEEPTIVRGSNLGVGSIPSSIVGTVEGGVIPENQNHNSVHLHGNSNLNPGLSAGVDRTSHTSNVSTHSTHSGHTHSTARRSPRPTAVEIEEMAEKERNSAGGNLVSIEGNSKASKPNIIPKHPSMTTELHPSMVFVQEGVAQSKHSGRETKQPTIDKSHIPPSKKGQHHRLVSQYVGERASLTPILKFRDFRSDVLKPTDPRSLAQQYGWDSNLKSVKHRRNKTDIHIKDQIQMDKFDLDPGKQLRRGRTEQLLQKIGSIEELGEKQPIIGPIITMLDDPLQCSVEMKERIPSLSQGRTVHILSEPSVIPAGPDLQKMKNASSRLGSILGGTKDTTVFHSPLQKDVSTTLKDSAQDGNIPAGTFSLENCVLVSEHHPQMSNIGNGSRSDNPSSDSKCMSSDSFPSESLDARDSNSPAVDDGGVDCRTDRIVSTGRQRLSGQAQRERSSGQAISQAKNRDCHTEMPQIREEGAQSVNFMSKSQTDSMGENRLSSTILDDNRASTVCMRRNKQDSSVGVSDIVTEVEVSALSKPIASQGSAGILSQIKSHVRRSLPKMKPELQVSGQPQLQEHAPQPNVKSPQMMQDSNIAETNSEVSISSCEIFGRKTAATLLADQMDSDSEPDHSVERQNQCSNSQIEATDVREYHSYRESGEMFVFNNVSTGSNNFPKSLRMTEVMGDLLQTRGDREIANRDSELIPNLKQGHSTIAVVGRKESNQPKVQFQQCDINRDSVRNSASNSKADHENPQSKHDDSYVSGLSMYCDSTGRRISEKDYYERMIARTMNFNAYHFNPTKEERVSSKRIMESESLSSDPPPLNSLPVVHSSTGRAVPSGQCVSPGQSVAHTMNPHQHSEKAVHYAMALQGSTMAGSNVSTSGHVEMTSATHSWPSGVEMPQHPVEMPQPPGVVLSPSQSFQTGLPAGSSMRRAIPITQQEVGVGQVGNATSNPNLVGTFVNNFPEQSFLEKHLAYEHPEQMQPCPVQMQPQCRESVEMQPQCRESVEMQPQYRELVEMQPQFQESVEMQDVSHQQPEIIQSQSYDSGPYSLKNNEGPLGNKPVDHQEFISQIPMQSMRGSIGGEVLLSEEQHSNFEQDPRHSAQQNVVSFLSPVLQKTSVNCMQQIRQPQFGTGFRRLSTKQETPQTGENKLKMVNSEKMSSDSPHKKKKAKDKSSDASSITHSPTNSNRVDFLFEEPDFDEQDRLSRRAFRKTGRVTQPISRFSDLQHDDPQQSEQIKMTRFESPKKEDCDVKNSNDEKNRIETRRKTGYVTQSLAGVNQVVIEAPTYTTSEPSNGNTRKTIERKTGYPSQNNVVRFESPTRDSPHIDSGSKEKLEKRRKTGYPTPITGVAFEEPNRSPDLNPDEARKNIEFRRQTAFIQEQHRVEQRRQTEPQRQNAVEFEEKRNSSSSSSSSSSYSSDGNKKEKKQKKKEKKRANLEARRKTGYVPTAWGDVLTYKERKDSPEKQVSYKSKHALISDPRLSDGRPSDTQRLPDQQSLSNRRASEPKLSFQRMSDNRDPRATEQERFSESTVDHIEERIYDSESLLDMEECKTQLERTCEGRKSKKPSWKEGNAQTKHLNDISLLVNSQTCRKSRFESATTVDTGIDRKMRARDTFLVRTKLQKQEKQASDSSSDLGSPSLVVQKQKAKPPKKVQLTSKNEEVQHPSKQVESNKPDQRILHIHHHFHHSPRHYIPTKEKFVRRNVRVRNNGNTIRSLQNELGRDQKIRSSPILD